MIGKQTPETSVANTLPQAHQPVTKNYKL